MPVEDVFSITGRGTVATGRIETGVITQVNEVESLLDLVPKARKQLLPVWKCSVKFLTDR